MKTLEKLSRFTLLSLFLIFASCSDDDNGPTDPPETDVTIVAAAQATPQLSSLVSALQKADESSNNDLVAALSGEGPFTVFAPTNDAFADLLAQLDGFDSLDDFNTQQLQDLLAVVLTYHVVADAAVMSSDLSDGQTITTLGGSTLEVSTQGGVFISDATAEAAQVTTADIVASNGVVHIIDKVLLPQAALDALADVLLVPITDLALGNENLENLVAALVAANGDLPTVLRGEGPFTVLAPTDEAFETFLDGAQLGDIPVDVLTNVLLNHVISGEVTSDDLTGLGSGYTSTLAVGAGDQNMSLFFDTSGDVTFNGVSTVVMADVKALNGIVHVVDAVIDLPNIVDHAVANPNLTSLVAALTNGGNTTFTDLLSDETEDFTVFAPLNDAFDAFTNPNSNDLNAILSNHVVVGAAAFSSGLTNSYVNTAAEFDTDENLSLYINMDDGVTLNGTSNVVLADIVATNGVIHAVDAVIDLPTVVTFAVADPNFSTLVQALTELTPSVDFVSVLSVQGGAGSDPFTVFAPTNAAFEALAAIPAEADLIPILQHHVVAGANVRSGDLSDGIMATTLEGDAITINLPGTGDNIADVTDGAGNTGIGIDAVDVQAINGVIHVLDTVLIPDTTN
ncbi:Uncaracterized surface protein containing fasciclin (FAS1) repeats [Flagellimonas taeanensis]|uniref:Uncaracterized surface protein containing fasciclin (FAS1) repeats n=1 Tax=Flagellimonas taeanensis TaxID=1005926 RepID=A0A1M7CAH4_9FLAO|nr:fasciclin domain-containing protein [Allomuricauda taeanensis]SFC61476.1 Uncaracterized surface protein containing fasciclin (FAS1) repeats [Allomuricauda taeanensis]SHL64187.1 Uncaracterized surface protein containing fasciclin (FAS1) repeats [Allomuricauda taeanensis]